MAEERTPSTGGTLVLVGLFALLLGVPTQAHARRRDRCPDEARAVQHTRPRWPEQARFRVVDERIELRCERTPPHGELICDWYSVHAYERDDPGAEAPATTMELTLPNMLATDVRVSVDGRSLALDSFGRPLADGPDPVVDHQPEVEPIAIDDDGRTTTIVVELWFTGIWSPANFPCGGEPAAEHRHFFLGQEPRKQRLRSRELDPSDAEPGHMTVRIEAGGQEKITTRTKIRDPPRRDSAGVSASFDSDAPIEARVGGGIPWGLFIGAGGALLDVDHPLRGRVGAELAGPHAFGGALFHSLAFETDFRRTFTLIPAIELTHDVPWWMSIAYVIPSVGIGTGVPLQIGPELRPGLRALANLSWPFIGFVATFDWYPAFATGQDSLLQLGLMGELRF